MERRSVLRFLLVFLLSLCAEGASIALGEGHSCIMLTGGTVKCWGYNLYGQLGNGTLGSGTDSPTPVDVSGITTAASIALGAYHSCALLTDGTVKCWGRDHKGQLGNGDETTADSATPVDVSGITTATSLAPGGSQPNYHSCALLTGGTVKCWGSGYYGQLGNEITGTTADSATPVDVTGITTATSIAVGGQFSCAVLTDGTVKCWGENIYGQLGNGTTTPQTSTTPVDVSGITTATSIALGHAHACALLTDGAVMCWGYNDKGQLGDGTSETQRSEPVFALQISVLPRPCTCCESELKRYGFSAGAECHVEL